MAYIASCTYGSNENGCSSETRVLGNFDVLSDAINACCNYALREDEDFDDEREICEEALTTRGYYCVGYSTLSLFVDEQI